MTEIDLAMESDSLNLIMSQLTHLRTKEQLFKELIQNADDAEATSISFHFSREGLLVSNDASLSSCSNLETDSYNCTHIAGSWNKYCDIHALRRFASGNKKPNPETTGKFGVGFVSVYLITDRPTMSSNKIKLIFKPEMGKVGHDVTPHFVNGTELWMPWAEDETSTVRVGIEKGIISPAEIPEMIDRAITACWKAFVFLKNVSEIKIQTAEKLRLHLRRTEDNGTIEIIDVLRGRSSKWMSLTLDSTLGNEMKSFQLGTEGYQSRRTAIELLIPKEVANDFEGLLYATLPTEVKLHMPFHINADFYPDSSRDSLLFSDQEREMKSIWNEKLISTSAKLLAKSLMSIQDWSGNESAWKIIEGAFSVADRKDPDVPSCFSDFWKYLKSSSAHFRIVECQKGEFHSPEEIILVSSLFDPARRITDELGIHRQVYEDSSREEILIEFGTTELSQSHLYQALKMRTETLQPQDLSGMAFSKTFWKEFYETINKLLRIEQSLHEELLQLKIWMTSKGTLSEFAALHILPKDVSDSLFQMIFPEIQLANKDFDGLDRITRDFETIDHRYLIGQLPKPSLWNEFLGHIQTSKGSIEAFDLLFEIVKADELTADQKLLMRKAPIWPSSTGNVTTLDNATLPGTFSDPLGVGNVLASDRFSTKTRNFLISYLSVDELTLDVYILRLLPGFLDRQEITADHAKKLLQQLANVSEEINSELAVALSELPILPTENGRLLQPGDCLWPSREMKELFSYRSFEYVNSTFLTEGETEESKFSNLLSKIHVSFSPSVNLILDAWREIQNNLEERDNMLPNLERLGKELIHLLDEEKKSRSDEVEVFLFSNLLYPCTKKCINWHAGLEVILNRWAPTVCDQEGLHELAFAFNLNFATLVTKHLKIVDSPSIVLVANHLKHCAVDGQPPDPKVYSFLNVVSRTGSDSEKSLISSLRTVKCIYDLNTKEFWAPQDIYSSIPTALNFLSSFSHYVKDPPSGREDLWTLFGIQDANNSDVPRYLPTIKERYIVSGGDDASLRIYKSAVSIIGRGYSDGEDWAKTFLFEFQSSPLVLTRGNQWLTPSEVVLVDSLFWGHHLSKEFSDLFAEVEPEAFDFLIASGSRRLGEAIEVANNSIDIDGYPNQELTTKFQTHSEILKQFVAHQLVNGSQGSEQRLQDKVEELQRFRNLKVFLVEDLEVGVTVNAGEVKRTELVALPQLYNSILNKVAVLDSNKNPYFSSVQSLLHYFVPFISDTIALADALSSAIQFRTPIDAKEHLADIGLLYEGEYLKMQDRLESSQIDLGDVSPEKEDFDEDGSSAVIDSTSENLDHSNSHDHVDYAAAHVEISLEPSQEQDKALPSSSGQAASSSDSATKSTSPSKAIGVGTNSIRGGVKTQASSEPHQLPSQHSSPHVPSNTSPESSSRKSSNSWRAKKSGYAFAKGEASEEGRVAHSKNIAVEAAGIDWIKAKDFECHRTVENINDTNPNNKGFDLISTSNSDPNDVRWIEVKVLSQAWPEVGVPISPSQFESFISRGQNAWLYVVEYALNNNPDAPRLHRIRNPYSRIRSIYFDDGWREIAEISPHQNPPPLKVGLRVIHEEYGVGYIVSEPKRQGVSIYCKVSFDSQLAPMPIQWDDLRMRVELNPDVDS